VKGQGGDLVVIACQRGGITAANARTSSDENLASMSDFVVVLRRKIRSRLNRSFVLGA
jgi:hypothetical protein